MKLRLFLLYLATSLIRYSHSLLGLPKISNYWKFHQIHRNQLPCLHHASDAFFLDELELKSWGSFSNTLVKLQARPSFSVITGKSGTGKSVLIGAFEYLIKQGRDSNKRASREIFSISGDDSASISIKRNGKVYQRTFSIASKKSVCDIDGKRVPIKQFTKKLPIRFWYKDSLKYLDSGSDGVITYIHDLTSIEESFLSTLATSHSEWQTKQELIHKHEEYENINEVKKMELSMLRHFVDEVDKVRGRIIDVLHDVNQNIEFLLYDYADDEPKVVEKGNGDEDSNDELKAESIEVTHTVTSATKKKTDSKLDLKSLHKYLENVLLFDDQSSNNNSNSDSSSNSDSGGGGSSRGSGSRSSSSGSSTKS